MTYSEYDHHLSITLQCNIMFCLFRCLNKMIVSGKFCGKGVVNIQECCKKKYCCIFRILWFLLDVSDGVFKNAFNEEETI